MGYINANTIKRHKIITHYPGDYHNGWNDAIDEILEDERADVQEVKHAHWIKHKSVYTPEGCLYLECSSCHNSITLLGRTFPYCPNCGAKMDGKENG